jgi:hypothetical protein
MSKRFLEKGFKKLKPSEGKGIQGFAKLLIKVREELNDEHLPDFKGKARDKYFIIYHVPIFTFKVKKDKYAIGIANINT